jgi:hypothetical protein
LQRAVAIDFSQNSYPAAGRLKLAVAASPFAPMETLGAFGNDTIVE